MLKCLNRLVQTWRVTVPVDLALAMSAAPTATGAAKRARERKQRCTARRVEWLHGLYRSAATHHTLGRAAASGHSSVEVNGQVWAALVAQVADLQLQVEVLAGLVTRDGEQAAVKHKVENEVCADLEKRKEENAETKYHQRPDLVEPSLGEDIRPYAWDTWTIWWVGASAGGCNGTSGSRL